MLKSIVIKNIGLIEDISLEFEKGLTSITGETGAGKSMFADALYLSCGGRTKKKHKNYNGISEATFVDINKNAQNIVQQNTILADETILRRVVENETTKAFLNGFKTPVSTLKELGDELLDIHSQFDNQQLLNPAYHTLFLDSFAKSENLISKTNKSFHDYQNIKNELQDLKNKKENIEADEILKKSYINELEILNVKENEEEEIKQERDNLKMSQSAGEVFLNINATLPDVLNGLNKITSNFSKVKNPTPNLEKIIERFDNSINEINDISYELDIISSNLNYDEAYQEKVEERYFTLLDVAHKHQTTISNLNNVLQALKDDLNIIENIDIEINNLEVKYKKYKDIFIKDCEALTAHRQKNILLLNKEVELSLKNLHMPNTKFDARVIKLKEPNKNGAESIEFYASINIGSQFLQIADAASGGELARIMLALKEVIYKNIQTKTIVFDEIDIGVGGATATAIGKTLAQIAKNHQVFVITHQAQVAALADNNLKIQKIIKNDKTITIIKKLTQTEKEQELARMLSGEIITEQATEAAKSLINSHKK